MTFTPYLNFGGNCREAMTRYQEIFGGELEVMTFADMPADEDAPPFPPDMVMNAALTVDGHLLMASDDPTGDFQPSRGTHVTHTTADLDRGRQVFDALADGGEVTMPFGPTFWAAGFGMCVDRYGTPWMVNVEFAGS